MPPRNAAEAPNFEQAFAELALALHGLVGPQTQFMRSAAEADPSIGTSLSTPLLPSEVLVHRKLTTQSRIITAMAFQPLVGTTDLSCLMTMSSTLTTMTTTQLIIVTAPTGVTVTTKSHLSAQTSSLLGTELEAAISEVSIDYYLQTVI